jgi:heat shock protein HslJ
MSYDWASTKLAPFLRFDGLGHFNGSENCVWLSGTVTVQQQTVSFTQIHRTRIRCSGSPAQYLDDILTTGVSWSVSHGELRLTAHGVTLGFIRP